MKAKLKITAAFLLSAAVVCGGFVFAANHINNISDNVYAEAETEKAKEENKTIILHINDPIMQVDGNSMEIDPGKGTAPVVLNGRTLVPIRAIIENMGGKVEWDPDTKTTTLTYNENVIRLTIDSKIAYFNDISNELDVAAVIIDGRTMLPVRFIAESFDFAVNWDQTSQAVMITSSEEKIKTDTKPELSENASVVYMTEEITPEALVEIYDKLGFVPDGNVAVKMSTGEPPNSNYLRPELIKDLVQKVNGTIVECNTAYGGSRAETAEHKQVAEDHGFTAIANVDIMDEDDSMEIPSENGTVIKTDYVGSHLANYDSLISLAHFKGHAMAGYGGAVKNMSIGIASSMGKAWIHSGGTSTSDVGR